ncbi:acyltransferase family protein [Neobacillus cucumis]|uniref:acyltransferase family protein n=1 Tax=Neobacillus cucumis TaxID=1740721 RepID=UPI0028535723|nr:acyltransferase [Neobacillus cucumis]MDR4949074.1 acyltransferase [Neobacillus cucumis]
MNNGRRKLSYVQISRAIAILFVLLGHVNTLFYIKYNYDWFNMGKWDRTGGVDFFFIVSGFMIYYLYHKHAGLPGKAKEFLLKRIIRIYPLYWLCTFILIALPLCFPSRFQGYSWELIIKSIIILPPIPILDSAWSLCHVMFFYLLFSAFLFRPKIFKPVIFLWIVATVLIELKIVPYPEGSFIFSFSSLEVFLGCLVAHLTLNYNFKQSTLFITIGLLGFLAVWINNIYNFMYIHGPTFFSMFSMILMLGISEKDKKDRKVPKLLSFLGDASYSIYIAHASLLHLFLYLLVQIHLVSTLGYFFSMTIVILLTVITCCIIYQLVEKPISRYLRRIVFMKKNKSIEITIGLAK